MAASSGAGEGQSVEVFPRAAGALAGLVEDCEAVVVGLIELRAA